MKTEKENYINPLHTEGCSRFDIEKPEIHFPLPYHGTLTARSTDEITSSNWLLGCETLDRGYADYDAYKEYLCPLGIKYIRLQGGWARTEQVRGVYDWAWLDHIIDDAVSRGLKPWLQTGYGNPIYPGAGGENLGAGMPLSEEGLTAYEKWVNEMASRYADQVRDWEVWNEPNFGDNKSNSPEISADFNIRTAKIIKGIQPDARISALALGHINLEYVERFFQYLYDRDACSLFHNVTYHDYTYNPDANKLTVYRMRQIVEKYAPGMILRQGENGAPSEGHAGGALFDYDWTELSQAKWDVRRMLENLGNRIECSIFSIADMQYTGKGPIRTVNTKGLLKSDAENRIIRPKIAYYAVQNVAAIFDHTLEEIPGTVFSHGIDETDTNRYWISTDRSISVYGYRKKESGERLYAIWRDDGIPSNTCDLTPYDFAFVNSGFASPVLVDILTGCVYEITETFWRRDGNIDRFYQIPVYDSPVLIAEKDMIHCRMASCR